MLNSMKSGRGTVTVFKINSALGSTITGPAVVVSLDQIPIKWLVYLMVTDQQ